MLYFLVVWPLLGVICYVIGIGILSRVQPYHFSQLHDRTIASVWVGLVIYSITLQAVALLIPLSPGVGALVALSLMGLSCFSPKTRVEISALYSSLSPQLGLASILLTALVALFNNRQVTWLDTGLYHYAAIRWLADYGVVPGIALWIRQFGFTSSWFALAAPFNPASFGSRVSAIANGFVLLLTLLHCLVSAYHSFSPKARLSDWFIFLYSLLLLPFLMATTLMSTILVSPSPDIPVLLYTGATAWTFLLTAKSSLPGNRHSVEDRSIPQQVPIVPLILACGAVSMKLSALPLLFITLLFYVASCRWRIHAIGLGLLIVFLLLLPGWMVGIMTAGCPLYPSSFFCLDVPWGLTLEQSQMDLERARGWGSWVGTPPEGAIPWLWLFWQWLQISVLNKLFALLALLSIGLAIYILRSFWLDRNAAKLWLIALSLFGTGFMMLQAPLFRLSVGYVVILPILFLSILCQEGIPSLPILSNMSLPNWSRWHSRTFSPLLLGLFGLVSVFSIAQAPSSHLVFPPPLPVVDVQKNQVNHITYFSPVGSDTVKISNLCWAAPLPCTFTFTDKIWLREPEQGIRGGFIRTPSPGH